MTVRLLSLTTTLALITACGTQTSDYSLISLELSGAEGAQLDEENGRVYTGMPEVICDATPDMEINDLDVAEAEQPEVLDVRGDAVLYLDGGVLEIVDYQTGEVADVPVEPTEDGMDAQLTEDGLVLLDGCEVKFSSGAVTSLPGEVCSGELIAGDGLMVRLDGYGVYAVTPERATRVASAQSVAWDPLNDQWLLAVANEMRGWSRGSELWSYSHDRGLVDVFPMSGQVGFRDTDGQVYELKHDGKGSASDVVWIGIEGDVVGSIREGTLAISHEGLTVIAFD